MSSKQIEISEIDRKYEGYRVQSASREKLLLGSISERGIDDPVLGVFLSESKKYVLLDGFKRLRCAIKLGHHQIEFICVGDHEVDCILHLLRLSNSKGLTMLEQAKLVDELNRVFALSIGDIASQLQRGGTWVRVRLQVLSEMGVKVMDEIIRGRFPMYSYLYTLRPHRRLHKEGPDKEVEKFIDHMSGKNLSTRDIELLAAGYFRGGIKVKQEIESGNIGWCIKEMKDRAAAKSTLPIGLNEMEKKTIRDLELMSQLMGRLPLRLTHRDVKSNLFLAEAVVIVRPLMELMPVFITKIRSFYDRCGVAESHSPIERTGDVHSRDV